MTKNRLSAVSVFNRLVDLTVNKLLLSRQSYTTPSLLDPENRDLDKECGYPKDEPSIEQYLRLYERCDIANRVVSVFSAESWSVPPTVFQTERNTVTAFERSLDRLVNRHNPWNYLERADELSGIGRYGIVVYGIDDGMPLDKPVRGIDQRDGSIDVEYARAQKGRMKLLYIRPYSENLVDIDSVEQDDRSPRYGMPVMYKVTAVDPRNSDVETESEMYGARDVMVHWTRVQHVAEGRGESDVTAMPRLKPVFNRVLDVRKIAGSSAEMFYKGAFPGISFETFPELTEEAEIDSDSVKKEIEAYSSGLQRYLRLIGMTAKSLAPQVADPTNHLHAQLQLICATIQVPLPIFLGNEAAHLASAQNMVTWTRRLRKRLKQYVGPSLVRGFIDRMMAYGVLPYTEDYTVSWEDMNVLSDLDRAQVSLQKAQALLQYVTSGTFALVPPVMFLQHVLGFTAAETQAIIDSAGGEEKIVSFLKETLQPPNGQNSQTDPLKKRNGLG